MEHRNQTENGSNSVEADTLSENQANTKAIHGANHNYYTILKEDEP